MTIPTCKKNFLKSTTSLIERRSNYCTAYIRIQKGSTTAKNYINKIGEVRSGEYNKLTKEFGNAIFLNKVGSEQLTFKRKKRKLSIICPKRLGKNAEWKLISN